MAIDQSVGEKANDNLHQKRQLGKHWKKDSDSIYNKTVRNLLLCLNYQYCPRYLHLSSMSSVCELTGLQRKLAGQQW